MAKHDGREPSEHAMDALSDGVSVGGHTTNTFNTWATNYTDCTNATFSKIHKNWSANASAYHKEVCFTLLASVLLIKCSST